VDVTDVLGLKTEAEADIAPNSKTAPTPKKVA